MFIRLEGDLYWLCLILAILLEVAGTTAMKLSEGFTRLVPSIALFVLYLGSFGLLTLALKQIPVTIAYAVWSGVGSVLIVLIGVMIFKETMSPIKIGSIALIIVGVIGLNLTGSAH